MDNASIKTQKYAHMDTWQGFCLNCRAKLSFCGKPFTADLECPTCGAVNGYENSFQPVRLKDRIEVFDVRVVA